MPFIKTLCFLDRNSHSREYTFTGNFDHDPYEPLFLCAQKKPYAQKAFQGPGPQEAGLGAVVASRITKRQGITRVCFILDRFLANAQNGDAPGPRPGAGRGPALQGPEKGPPK